MEFWGDTNDFVRLRVAGLYANRCAYCGRLRKRRGQMTCDHLIPIAQGGSTWENNLLPSCRVCNNLKGDETIPEFRERLRHLASTVRPTNITSKKDLSAKLKRIAFAKRFLVGGKIKFWFERHPPTRTDVPVLKVLQKIVLEEKLNPLWLSNH